MKCAECLLVLSFAELWAKILARTVADPPPATTQSQPTEICVDFDTSVLLVGMRVFSSPRFTSNHVLGFAHIRDCMCVGLVLHVLSSQNSLRFRRAAAALRWARVMSSLVCTFLQPHCGLRALAQRPRCQLEGGTSPRCPKVSALGVASF